MDLNARKVRRGRLCYHRVYMLDFSDVSKKGESKKSSFLLIRIINTKFFHHATVKTLVEIDFCKFPKLIWPSTLLWD